MSRNHVWFNSDRLLDATEGLTARDYGAFMRVVMIATCDDGGFPDHAETAANLLHIRKSKDWQACRARLLERGLIRITDDGLIVCGVDGLVSVIDPYGEV